MFPEMAGEDELVDPGRLILKVTGSSSLAQGKFAT